MSVNVSNAYKYFGGEEGGGGELQPEDFHELKMNGGNVTRTYDVFHGLEVTFGSQFITKNGNLLGEYNPLVDNAAIELPTDASDDTSTFTKANGDTSTMTSGSKLSAIFGAISSFFASLKALAFKDKASYNDLSSGVQSSLNKADSALQSHQSVTDNNPTLAWGSTSTVGTVGNTNLRVTMPSNPASGKADNTPTFTEASTRANLNGSGETMPTILGKIKKWFTDLGSLAFKDTLSSFNYESIGSTAVDLNDKLYANECHAYVWNYVDRNNVANKPTNDGGVVLSFAYYSDTYGVQIAMDGNDYEKPLYVRFKAANQWGSWIPFRDASWINSGTFGTDRIADDAITAAKVKDNETLPVNVSGTAKHLSAYGQWDTWNGTYVESTPFALIGEQTWSLTNNDGEGSVLQFERNNELMVRLKLCIVTVGSTVSRAEAILLESTASLTDVRSNIKITYFTYTSNNTPYIAVRLYVKFTSNWQNWRVRQLDCQTADNGYQNWRLFGFRSGRGSDQSSAVGTPATYSFRAPYTSGQVGSSSTPVYVDSNGQVQPCDPSQIPIGNATYASNTLTIPQGKFVDATSISLGASVTLAFANSESVSLPWWWFRIAATAGVTLSVPAGYGFMGETLTTLEANKTYEFVVIKNKITWAVSV